MRKYKVVLIGSSHTGKTSIVNRYINNAFTYNTQTSTQAAFYQKDMTRQGFNMILEIWDTAGQERFHALIPMFYRDAKGAFVVYDITDQNSFDHAKQWVNELRQARGDDIVLLLVGNKCDLQSERIVSEDEALDYAKSANLTYFETSAKSGANVDLVFQAISNKFKKLPEDPNDTKTTRAKRSVRFDEEQPVPKVKKEESSCC